MDTTNSSSTAKYTSAPCIIVDWDTYMADDSDMENFLVDRSNFYDIVVFVTNPDVDPGPLPSSVPWEATAIIRNSKTKPLSPDKFKLLAFETLKSSSNLFPVMALDADYKMQIKYEAAGVLMSMGDVWL